jgi:phosphoesterase RecJ-like protein
LNGKRVGVSGHLHPDSDCIGAQIAMRDILIRCGATSLMELTEHNIATNLQWIIQDYDFVRPEEMVPDEYIFVDCGMMSRAGNFVKKLQVSLMSVDHHISGEKLAKLIFLSRIGSDL